MGLPQSELPFDADAFLAWEEGQEARHEFIAGEVLAMSGGTDAHYTITLNLSARLKADLRGTPCRPFLSGMQVRVEVADAVLYPDVFVTCDPRDRGADAQRVKRHPLLIAEVLSATTSAYDRGLKFELYQRLESLQEYLLIEQDRLHADLFRRNAEGLWVLHPLGPGATVHLQSVSLTLPIEALYEDVEGLGGA
jgi:Uma2 family endonuclease